MSFPKNGFEFTREEEAIASHSGELRSLISSADGAAVDSMLSRLGVGDEKSVRAALGAILSTPEGARLAQRIKAVMEHGR